MVTLLVLLNSATSMRLVLAVDETSPTNSGNIDTIFSAANSVEWKYLDNGSDQGTAWTNIDFDDITWKTGTAPLGYGRDNNDLNTVISYGSDSGNKHVTTYYRKTFQLNDAGAIKQLEASLVRDDGAVVYLNGQEVYRSNMPDGSLAFDTLAVNAVNNERDAYEFDIDPTLLRDGKNVIAVEVHQINRTSSDKFFSLELESSTEEPVNNQGLLTEFYTNTGNGSFDKVDCKSTVIRPNIEFSNLDSLMQQYTGRADDVNIDFSGQIVPEHTEDYTFYLIGDNGFKLWVNNQLIIDHWENDWDKEQISSPIHLEAGEKYDFRIEYFEDFGGSNLNLRWSSPSVAKQIVPETAFFLPSDYTGPISGTIASQGDQVSLKFAKELSSIPADLASQFTVLVDGEENTISAVEMDKENKATLELQVVQPIKPDQVVNVEYNGTADFKDKAGKKINSFKFTPENTSEFINYAPISIAMSLYGDAKTQRSFAWYTNHEMPENAPENVLDTIVEVVPAGSSFDLDHVQRFSGESQVLNLKITNSQNGMFASHKAIVTGLEPGTAYEYRLGSDGNWSEIGEFTTEAIGETNFEFLYMTDSQGANSHDYEVWADTLRQGLEKYPNSQFLTMSGDQVDAGALEYQWLDYFAKPQDLLMNLPIMAAVGNHEGPYNDNYYYHFNYPNDSIEDPLPPGSVYSYDYGDAHFMVVNTMDMGWDVRQRESFKQQIEWLKREVAETDKKWKVVTFHKAIYSVGGHATDGDILELREMLYPVFDELGIDVVLQGHDHSFMRSHQMYNDEPILDVETDAEGNVINPEGTMYIVNNSAGTKYYNVRDDVDKYYAAKFEQPYEPIFSGVTMTDDSFTIDSYRSGEDEPFDTYTIIRNDNMPNKVDNLSAVKNGEGNILLSWDKPSDTNEEDKIRGFRIYEKEGRLGANWTAYMEVEEGVENYSYTVTDAETGELYEFAVKAVDNRDNSEPSFISTEAIKLAAPTNPVVDDGYNTFGWTYVPGFENVTDYEYSVDHGETWENVIASPQLIGDVKLPAGAVQVRLKANDASGEAGKPLVSTEAYTKNKVKETFAVEGTLTRGEQLQVDVTVNQQADYNKDAYLVFELFDGNTPLLINAVPIDQEALTMSQYFDVSGSNYKVKVFVFNKFTSELDLPALLSEPLELK